MHLRRVPEPPGRHAKPKARSGSAVAQGSRACLVLVRDLQLANAVVVGMRSQLAVAGRDMPVLVPPMYGDEFSAPGAAERLRGWWDEQRTGVELTAATLLIVDVEDLAGLGRIA
jgi:hypothetical protein